MSSSECYKYTFYYIYHALPSSDSTGGIALSGSLMVLYARSRFVRPLRIPDARPSLWVSSPS